MFDGLSVASSGERVNNRKNESRHLLLTLAQCREENVNHCWARSKESLPEITQKNASRVTLKWLQFMG